MKKYIIPIFLFFAILLFCIPEPGFSQDNNWTHFRGSERNGISLTDQIPLNWNDSTIRWRTAIHDRGFSSPVVYGDQIWLTTATDDGKALYAVCVDYQTGNTIHDILVFTPEEVISKHSWNTYASCTPCIEKDFVYVHYGSMGTACIRTTDGTIVWKRDDLKCDHVQGAASSPVLYNNLVILHFEGVDVRYLVALDKSTGKTVWKTDRPEEPYETMAPIGKKAYVTPIILNVKGRDMLISNGSAVCCAYDPLTGKELWRVVRGAESTVPMPFTENGVVYFYTGDMRDSSRTNFAELIAVNPDGNGDITNTNVLWKKPEYTSHTLMLTPVIKDGLIYTITSRNVLMCIDASNGTEVWSVRLKPGVEYNASPVYAEGNVWFFSVKGDVFAIKAGRKYELLVQQKMDSGIWATPAFLRNAVILRTEKMLYRIEKQP
jgi:outer membrane protein assembly factor BamB